MWQVPTWVKVRSFDMMTSDFLINMGYVLIITTLIWWKFGVNVLKGKYDWFHIPWKCIKIEQPSSKYSPYSPKYGTYGHENCAWCVKQIEPESQTIDSIKSFFPDKTAKKTRKKVKNIIGYNETDKLQHNNCNDQNLEFFSLSVVFCIKTSVLPR